MSDNQMHNHLIDDPAAIYIQKCPGSEYFDTVVGFIEDIVVQEDFKNIQKMFFETYWQTFENTEENKFEYMDIFNNYTATIESFIVDQLKKQMDNFDMEIFSRELQENKPVLDGEIFELLMSLLDFIVFKELMLDYRAQKEGKYDNINFDIKITKLPNTEE